MKYDLSNKTEDELIELLHTKTPTGVLYIAAKIQYEKLLKKRNFWSKDIVAWLALAISVGSFIVSIIALYKKGSSRLSVGHLYLLEHTSKDF